MSVQVQLQPKSTESVSQITGENLISLSQRIKLGGKNSTVLPHICYREVAGNNMIQIFHVQLDDEL
jgi:hypothetical protein